MEKVKVEIPLDVLHKLVVGFKLSVEEAIDVAVKGAVEVIKEDLKQQYEVYKRLQGDNNEQDRNIH